MKEPCLCTVNFDRLSPDKENVFVSIYFTWNLTHRLVRVLRIPRLNSKRIPVLVLQVLLQVEEGVEEYRGLMATFQVAQGYHPRL